MTIDKKISLDDFVPDYSWHQRAASGWSTDTLVSDNNKQSAKFKNLKYGWIKVNNDMMGRRDRALGVRPEKLIDWRSLERRYHQLDESWKDVDTKFWRSLMQFTRTKDRYETWIYIGDDELLRVQINDSSSSGGSYSSACASNIAKSLISTDTSTRCDQPQRMITYEKGGKEIAHLKMRSERLRLITWKYKSAFCRGIIDRIIAYNKANDPDYIECSYRNSVMYQTFIVSNEDRKYVFNCAPGKAIELVSHDDVIAC